MGSPTCPYCGCLAVTRAVEADGNAPSRSAAYRCERCLKLHERRPTPPAPADDAVEEAMAPGCHEHVALWDAINAYSAACGGHPTRGGGARMDAVVRVEAALRALPLPPASAGGEVEAALAGEAFGIVQHVVNHARCGINLDGTRRTYGSDEECGRNWAALIEKCEALLAALAAERAAAKGGNGA